VKNACKKLKLVLNHDGASVGLVLNTLLPFYRIDAAFISLSKIVCALFPQGLGIYCICV
jgi:hypothetical protein